MDKLFQELSRRKVLSSLLLYAMAAWLILQVTDVVAEPLLLPAWIQRTFVIAAILGFPLVAVLSWFFDLTKSGLVPTDSVEGDERLPLGFANFSISIVVLIGMSIVISRQWEESAINNESTAPLESRLISLAILPFEGTLGNVEPHLTRLSQELAVRLANNGNIKLASESAIALLPADAERTQQAAQLATQYILSGDITDASEGVSLSVWLFDAESEIEVWRRDFQNAQVYVVNDLVVNEMLRFFGLQPIGNGLLTTNAIAYDLYLKGLMNLASDTNDIAVSFFEEAISEDPRFPLPHASLCNYYVYLYRSERSIESFETAERFCFRALTLDDGSLEVHEAMASIYSASGQLEKARDSFKTALTINPRHFESNLGLARTYVSQDPVYAESILTELMRDHPGDPEVYSALQNLYFNQGRYQDAVEPARLALQLRPNSQREQYNLATNLLLSGNFTESKNILLSMLEEGSPRGGSIQNALATAYYFEGLYPEAAELYKDALAREPENAVFIRNLGDVTWHGQGENDAKPLFENVIDLGERHLQINPDDIGVLSSLIVAYGSIGDSEGLESKIQALLELSNTDPQDHYDIAVAYSRLGNPELSSQHANMAIELGYSSSYLMADPDLAGAEVSLVEE